jgi:uncharacterized protein (DUF2267 family)
MNVSFEAVQFELPKVPLKEPQIKETNTPAGLSTISQSFGFTEVVLNALRVLLHSAPADLLPCSRIS